MDPVKFNIDECLNHVRHWLPQQGPIKDFVHHNTLHAFQHLKFHDAVRAAAQLYGANAYMPFSFYLKNYRAGLITDSAIARVLAYTVTDIDRRAKIKQNLFSTEFMQSPRPEAGAGRLRERWQAELDRPNPGAVSLNRLVHPPLFRLIGGYLDQGLSTWRLPGADQLDFFNAVASLVQKSWLPLKPLNSPAAKKLLSLPAKDAAIEALKRLVSDEKLFETYILEMLLAQPGWAGLVSECEMHSRSLLSPRAIRLLDYVAIALVIEVAALERHLGPDFKPLDISTPNFSIQPLKPDAIPAFTDQDFHLQIWQEAFEWSYYENVLGGVAVSTNSTSPGVRENHDAWAFFCIDDRECSLRRHLEEVNPRIETFATAGFFGLDFMYQGANDTVPGKHCPVLITPKHLIIEEVSAKPGEKSATRWPRVRVPTWWRKIFPLEPESNTFFRGWILSHALGLGAALRLAASVFKPSLNRVAVEPLSTITPTARLRLSRQSDDYKRDGLWVGYSISELADRVKNLLHSSGAASLAHGASGSEKKWPAIVVFFGHGSSSVNNPYFAAYNCGACSGRMGAPNARAFAEAANMREVRELLQREGIEIPATTWFIGALHDTSRDEVTYYDIDKIPEGMRISFEVFRDNMEHALARNAVERCRRFETVPNDISAEHALVEVKTRAISLFEPRPEYNHATNAACIIGRRNLTEDIFLDRRAFLSSYDPLTDSTGEELTRMFNAAIPVCAGINLEYYFSRVNPTVYGAGSKLSHNVNGLIGLTNGIEGDLLTGLPTQMTEIHDPVRLLLLVEQNAAVALAAARRDPKIFEWIENEWVRFACIEPDTKDVYLYLNGELQKINNLKPPNKVWRNSLEAASASRLNLPAGRLKHL